MFDMGFDRAVNGSNELYKSSYSFLVLLMISLAGNFSLLIVLCIYGLNVSLLNGRQHSSLSLSSRLQQQRFT